MAELKTQYNDQSVDAFLNKVENEKRKRDAYLVMDLMKKVTNEAPRMWGNSIVGFGSYHYKYKSGREGDWFLTGFSPRKQSLTIYIMPELDQYEAIQLLGQYKAGKSCLYVKKIEDIDINILEQLIESSIKYLKEKYT